MNLSRLQANSGITSDSFNNKSYFFDNPRRYDSDDDITAGTTPQGYAGYEF